MTTLAEAREAIYKTFIDAWDSIAPLTLDNEDFQPPNGSWVRLSVRHTGGGQETLGRTGNRRFERSGTAFIQVFTLQDTGTAAADTLANLARSIFEGTSITNTTIRFNNVALTEIGPTGKWYQINVSAAFDYDETK